MNFLKRSSQKIKLLEKALLKNKKTKNNKKSDQKQKFKVKILCRPKK
ncbi:MAG: hypothetical protein M1168_00850 [Candidatus Marsarchaeota archaeon]|nr:hypothetical protein [Candidatus Marsarchaeota archaeon]